MSSGRPNDSFNCGVFPALKLHIWAVVFEAMSNGPPGAGHGALFNPINKLDAAFVVAAVSI